MLTENIKAINLLQQLVSREMLWAVGTIDATWRRTVIWNTPIISRWFLVSIEAPIGFILKHKISREWIKELYFCFETRDPSRPHTSQRLGLYKPTNQINHTAAACLKFQDTTWIIWQLIDFLHNSFLIDWVEKVEIPTGHVKLWELNLFQHNTIYCKALKTEQWKINTSLTTAIYLNVVEITAM